MLTLSPEKGYPPVEAPPMKELISLSVLGRQSKLMRFGHRPVALCCKNTELRLACFQLPASTNGGRVPYLIPDRHIAI